jgi:hypothetical protein
MASENPRSCLAVLGGLISVGSIVLACYSCIAPVAREAAKEEAKHEREVDEDRRSEEALKKPDDTTIGNDGLDGKWFRIRLELHGSPMVREVRKARLDIKGAEATWDFLFANDYEKSKVTIDPKQHPRVIDKERPKEFLSKKGKWSGILEVYKRVRE